MKLGSLVKEDAICSTKYCRLEPWCLMSAIEDLIAPPSVAPVKSSVTTLWLTDCDEQGAGRLVATLFSELLLEVLLGCVVCW